MNSWTVKILAALVSVLIITTLSSQIYYVFQDKHDTEEAVLTTIEDNIPFEGVFIRNEKNISYNGGGVINYLYADGSKVTADDVVAEAYSSEDAIIAKRTVNTLTDEIADLQRAQNPGTTNYVQPETIKTRIDQQYKQLLANVVDNNFTELAEKKKDLSVAMNLYDIVTKSESDFNARISQLNSDIAQLKATESVPQAEIKTSETGYFVSYADGYENTLSTDKADSITSADINSVLKGDKQSPDGTIGKVLDSYSCKIAGVVQSDKRIVEGVYLQMMLSTSKTVYDVYVESVKPCEDDENKCVVVFSCDRLDDELVRSRTASIELIFDEYQGIRVPRSAIRFQGEQKGVYLILGKDVTFKKIDVVYEGKDFVLSKNTSDEDYLLLYDQILLEVVSSKDVSGSSQSSKSGNESNKQ